MLFIVFFFSTDVIFLGIKFLWPSKGKNFESASDFVVQKRSRSMCEENILLVLTVIHKARYTFYYAYCDCMENTAHNIYSNCIIKNNDYFLHLSLSWTQFSQWMCANRINKSHIRFTYATSKRFPDKLFLHLILLLLLIIHLSFPAFCSFCIEMFCCL